MYRITTVGKASYLAVTCLPVIEKKLTGGIREVFLNELCVFFLVNDVIANSQAMGC